MMRDKLKRAVLQFKKLSQSAKQRILLCVALSLVLGSVGASWIATRAAIALQARTLTHASEALKLIDQMPTGIRKTRALLDRQNLVRKLSDASEDLRKSGLSARFYWVLASLFLSLFAGLLFLVRKALYEEIQLLLKKMSARPDDSRVEPQALPPSPANADTPDRVDALIRELQDMREIEEGSFQISRFPVPISRVLDPVLTTCTQAARARSQRIETRVIAENGVKDWEVFCDPDRIARALRNLLSNAISFTPPGETIALIAERLGNETRFMVADTGPGISEEKAASLLNPKITADPSLKTGGGLGLRVASAYIKVHGGKLWVESKFGKGSKFCFTVPARPAAFGMASEPELDFPGLKRGQPSQAVAQSPKN